MPGMKRDCGGAAAILGAFQSAVKAVSYFYFIHPHFEICRTFKLLLSWSTKIIWTTAKYGIVPDTTSNVQPI